MDKSTSYPSVGSKTRIGHTAIRPRPIDDTLTVRMTDRKRLSPLLAAIDEVISL